METVKAIKWDVLKVREGLWDLTIWIKHCDRLWDAGIMAVQSDNEPTMAVARCPYCEKELTVVAGR